MRPAICYLDRQDYWLAIDPEAPNWAAMNPPAKSLLEALAAGETTEALAEQLVATSGLEADVARHVVDGFAAETETLWRAHERPTYEGRAAYLRPQHLRELWLHVNERCNFACRHCLFSADGRGSDGLDTATLLQVIAKARELGVRTFYFTGGEPLLRSDLPELLAAALQDEDTHAVVLTNGSLVGDGFLAAMGELDRERLHLQISLDGSTAEINDRLRSPNAFRQTVAGLTRAVAIGLNITVATVVLADNAADLPALASLVRGLGVTSWHLMWPHLRERGAEQSILQPSRLAERLLALKAHCDSIGLRLDNFENVRGAVLGEPGVRRDGTGACWDSLAVYADGGVYPSAALVGIEEHRAGSVLYEGLERAWLESEVCAQHRSRSVTDDHSLEVDPLRFLHGGGDPEHAYFYSRGDGCCGVEADHHDPYLPVYRALLLQAVDEVVAERKRLMRAPEGLPLVYQLMGQDGLGCPQRAGAANGGDHRLEFTHSNCVLIQDVIGHSRQVVQDYYSEAAIEPKAEICCCVPVDRRYYSHIPQAVLDRSYGCGSPVFAAGLGGGETVVDLGSGGGIECFVASRLVGEEGRVIGVDMTPDMLAVAREAQVEVAANLGYGNVEFVRGYLEALPLADASADVVMSNCVINLSPEKLKVFGEVRRVLRPGGRMTISDIVAADRVPDQVRYNPRLKGECIAGALTRQELLLMLSKLGFDDIRIESQTPWRVIDGVQFFSETISAARPNGKPPLPPYAVLTALHETDERHTEGCVVCGKPLEYLDAPVAVECHYCGHAQRARVQCEAGHFVCDACHGGDYLRFVLSFAERCDLTDPAAVLLEMKEQFPFPVHGPEHHALAPAAFLIAYRNSGGELDAQTLEEAVREGSELPGGTCAYWGACSAALGIGIAYAAILKSSPLTGQPRGVSQEIVSRILGRVAELQAPRCCQRESLIAVKTAAEFSSEFLLHEVETSCCGPTCTQSWLNEECIGSACPFSG